MARGPAEAQRRQRELARMLSRGEDISTTDIAERLGVNPMTIRRDLKVLEASGLVMRRYGGALAAQRITFEFDLDHRHKSNLDEKRRIGEAAADRVDAHQTAFIDTGTTTLEVAKAMVRRGVPCRVATSSLVVAGALWGHRQLELNLLGGRVREGSPDLIGPATEVMLERLTADVAFLGSDGVDAHRGCFASDLEAARVAERMAMGAKRVIVVADHSKLGAAGNARFLRIEDLHELITDRRADRGAVAALRRRGVDVTVV